MALTICAKSSIIDFWQSAEWIKVFKNGPSSIYGKQSLKKLKRYGLPNGPSEICGREPLKNLK